MSLTQEELQVIENQLLEDEKNLLNLIKLGKSSSKAVSLDEPIGRVSRIDAIQHQKMAAEGLRRAELSLNLVRSALNKIKSNDYGYCARCEEPISFSRLKIKPESPFCVSCQGKSE